MKKKILISALVLAIVGFIYALSMYYKPHEDLNKSKPDYTLTYAELISQYDKNEDRADSLYLGKTVEISGKVNNIEKSESDATIAMNQEGTMTGILFEFEDEGQLDNIQEGQEVIIRGKCSGKLIDIVINRSILIQ